MCSYSTCDPYIMDLQKAFDLDSVCNNSAGGTGVFDLTVTRSPNSSECRQYTAGGYDGMM